MRTITSSSTININNTSSSPASSFDTSASQPYPAKRIRSDDTPSTRSFSASAANQNSLTVKRLVTAKSSPKSPVTTNPQARARFPSAPVTVPVSDSLSHPPSGFHHHKQQQHVLALTTTTTRSTSASSAPGSTSKMPPDSRPRPPQLSAAAAKNIGRTPLTPKIAAKAPLVRRSTQNRDDYTSAPRSGGRHSGSSTPNGTPNLERGHDGWDPRATLAVDSGRQSLSQTDSGNESADSKFFYASDVRNVSQPPSRPSSRPSSTAPKSSTFFYASNAAAESKRALSPPLKSNFTPILATPPETTQTKFFYASGTPEIPSKSSLPSGPHPGGSSSSRAMNGRPSTSGAATGSGYSMPPRPLSPIKMLQQHNPPPILKNSTTPGLNSRAQLTPSQFVSTPPITKRRISIDSAPRAFRGHARTSSVPSIDGNSPRVTMSPPPPPSEPSSPLASPTVTQPAMTMASILQAAEEMVDDDEEASPDIQSPTKSTNSSDPLTEMVANARRERKVQDLEITNASLEAINRTLERQLRKQTAEIRRFRRLSRSAHMATASEAPSRVPSQTLADIPISLTELSEEEDESMMSAEEEPDSFDDSELSSAESAADPLEPDNDKGDKGDKVTVRRNRDERRLKLDLSKHRELLVDSQKINQSLKRCLNWTEVLIKEGQKALQYEVRVSDVQFGGHVLAPPDEEDNVSQLDAQLLETLDVELEPLPAWEKSSQDRDSGIELQSEAQSEAV